MPNCEAVEVAAARLAGPLGAVVEFDSEHWGVVFGRINTVYTNMDGEVKEYWVENIDYSDFTPDRLVRLVEGGDSLPSIPKPKFRVGDVVKHHDGDRNLLLVVKDAECRVSKDGTEWFYFFKEKDWLGNPVPWDEPVKESECKRFKV